MNIALINTSLVIRVVCPAEFFGVDVAPAPGPACAPDPRDCLERQEATDAFKNEKRAAYTAKYRQARRSAGKGGFCRGHGIVADLVAGYGRTGDSILG